MFTVRRRRTLVGRGVTVTVHELDRLGRSTSPRAPRVALEGVAELAAWDVEVNRVLVVENLQSVLPLPDAHGTIAAHGAGFAVDLVGRLPWVQGASVDYWGDLDSHGFAILDRMRAHVPHARSLLMDTTTLLAHRELWTADPNPSTAALGRLTGAELMTRAELTA
ncbi:DUF2220 domain-containing protein [Cellulomonas denverensis]|uniref:DUF2220 domain-containing protein n=1 Tax=Cellulomonas denverensis TaxID=264297 RepID=A0A7X6QYS5_9CELL|nr:DUF2220 domain-containing protein [Cellulomonas denverensis]